MKIYVLLLSCVCSTLGITVHYKTTGSADNIKEYKTALKGIRHVPVNQADITQNQPQERKKETMNEIKNFQKAKEQLKVTRQNQQKYRGERRKSSIARVGNTPKVQNEPNQPDYIQKMANQLYMTQKHASLLSDYQKFIINQDPNVRNFVLGQSTQERNPKPFSRQRGGGRAISEAPVSEPVAATNSDYKKIVVVTPKVQTTARKVSRQQNDHSAQGTHYKYVTVAPQPLTHFVQSHQPSPKVTLVPIHTSQPYYDLGVTLKPQVKVVQVPATASLGLGSYESPQIYKHENEYEDHSHHDDAKYEFMYNVKDHEKNNHFGHKESRLDKTTYGYYFVHLPDGRLETVKYWADKTGYHAKVDYQGEAHHPVHSEHSLHHHNTLHH